MPLRWRWKFLKDGRSIARFRVAAHSRGRIVWVGGVGCSGVVSLSDWTDLDYNKLYQTAKGLSFSAKGPGGIKIGDWLSLLSKLSLEGENSCSPSLLLLFPPLT